MWSVLPVVEQVRKLAQRRARTVEELASESWEVAPASPRVTPPALALPEQWERIVSFSEFSTRDGDIRKVQGEKDGVDKATRAFRIRDAFLIDGVLYTKDGACLHLHPRSTKIPRLRVEQEIGRGAIYCTFGGNKYFGQWLQDDCVTYSLAAAEGAPITTAQPISDHARAYEARLEMKPVRAASAFIRDLVVFDDVGQNRSKHERFRALGGRLRQGLDHRPHPGIVIVRGSHGSRRVLLNELEIAERLRDRRGFTVIDPMKEDLPTILRACAGARMVVGIEGSALMHGVLMLEPGGGLLILQPPNRFSAIYKDLTDRDHQQFGYVVGLARGEDFWIDPDEVERTLDLFKAA